MEGSSGEVGMLIFLRATDALKERGFPSGAWVPTSLPISKPVSVRFMNFPLMYQDYIKRGGGGCCAKARKCSVQHQPEAGMGSLAFPTTEPMKCRGGHLESLAGLEAKSSVTVKFNGATLKISQKMLR